MVALLKMLLGFVGYVYKSFREYTELDGSPAIVITVRLTSQERHRCPICGRKISGKYDNGRQNRRWRSLDFGAHKGECYLGHLCQIIPASIGFRPSECRGLDPFYVVPASRRWQRATEALDSLRREKWHDVPLHLSRPDLPRAYKLCQLESGTRPCQKG